MNEDTFVEHGWRMVAIIGCVSLAAVMQFLDSTIVNVALPVIAGNLGATFEQIGWVVTAYSLAAVSVIPLTGWLSIRFGRRRYFVASIIGFTAASLLCGLSHTLPTLLAARVLQGLGGGGLVATSLAILISTLPRERQASAQGIFALIAVVGPALGPTLGGWLTDQFNWPLIFYINLPIGTLCAIVLALMLKESPAQTSRPVDVTGIVLLVSSLASLQYFLERGEIKEWFDAPGIAFACLWAIVGLSAFVVHSLRTAHPVLDLRILGNRNVAVGSMLGLAIGANLFGSLFLLPLYLQNVLGFTAMLTGLVLFVRAAATAVLTPFVAAALQRKLVEPRIVAGIGFAFLAWGTLAVARNVTAHSDSGNFVVAMMLIGISFAFLWTPVGLITLRSLPPPQLGYGSALLNLSVQIGGTVGIAVMTTLQDRRLSFWRQTVASSLTLHHTPIARMVQHGGMTHRFTLTLYALAQQQAYTLTFRDLFLILAIPVVAAIPLVVLVRRINAG